MKLTGQSVLVTGAMGCIGAWTVRELVARGAAVVTYDLSNDTRRLRLVMTPDQLDQVRFVQGDITDLEALQEVITIENVGQIIHLGALQLPFCKASPTNGARVNVVGTVNIFEAARRAGIPYVVYTSSIAIFDHVDGRLAADAVAQPSTHYGVYKLANEGTARAYWGDFGVASIGLRPTTVYGPGRDQGLTSSPTKAILATALGARYQIGFGGSTLFHYAPDVARALVQAMSFSGDGAHVFNLEGTTASISELIAVLDDVVDGANGLISQQSDPLPFPYEIESTREDRLGPLDLTSLNDGVTATVERFQALQADGRLVPEEHGLTIRGDTAVDYAAGG